ncbi:apoptosis-associated speck-like protein containing a CARD isoform X2 [Labeo rohita]|uniref:apoptosis-associated speck-like protein containing a CARD isoform X2 n=1 Tax=Labeo rohita TaxID=84645 RepID=UPI0021E1FE9B|nr:apoptosis-associated speck-like protein containing a CARD isoform X2 [Labeo rohita]
MQRVTSVMPIADELLSKGMIHAEKYAEIKAENTDQDKMRKLYESLKSGGDQVKRAFYYLLERNEEHLFKDLGGVSRKRKLSDQESSVPCKRLNTESIKQDSAYYNNASMPIPTPAPTYNVTNIIHEQRPPYSIKNAIVAKTERKTPAPKKEKKPSVLKKEKKTPPQKEKKPAVPKKENKTPAPKKEKKPPAPKKEKKTPAPKKEKKTPAPKKEKKTPAPKKEKKTPTPKKGKKTPAPKKEKKPPGPKKAKKPSVPKKAKKPPAPKKRKETSCTQEKEVSSPKIMEY